MSKPKQPDEFEEFDKTMGGLLSVPYSELQKKLEEEKREKTKQKRGRATSSPAAPSSSSPKKKAD